MAEVKRSGSCDGNLGMLQDAIAAKSPSQTIHKLSTGYAFKQY